MKKRTWLKTVLAATLICTSATFAIEGAAAKGNPKSKIYHKPACKHFKAKSSSISFASEKQATTAGYKACKKCSKVKKTAPKEKPAEKPKKPAAK